MPLPTVAVTESNLKMSAEVKDELAADGCYDLTHEGAVIGRLVWIVDVCARHPTRGWWLTIPGRSDELIYRVPPDLSSDLPRARQKGVSMSLGLAQQMLADRVGGLLDGPEAASPL